MFGADSEQTVICRFIAAFAISIAKSRVPHYYFSFEPKKFYLNTKCMFSDIKIRLLLP